MFTELLSLNQDIADQKALIAKYETPSTDDPAGGERNPVAAAQARVELVQMEAEQQEKAKGTVAYERNLSIKLKGSDARAAEISTYAATYGNTKETLDKQLAELRSLQKDATEEAAYQTSIGMDAEAQTATNRATALGGDIANKMREQRTRIRSESAAVTALLVAQRTANGDLIGAAQTAFTDQKRVLDDMIANPNDFTPEQINAQRAVVLQGQTASREAENAARYALKEISVARLEAGGNRIGAQEASLEIMKLQYADLVKLGPDASENTAARSLRAQIIRAETGVARARFDERADINQWEYSMEKITRTQLISRLEASRSQLVAGSKEWRDLELQIKQMKDDTSGNLQMNIPKNIQLPTLYEVRRLMGANGSNNALSQSLPSNGGYQDNRNVQVTVNVNNGMSETQIVDTLSRAMGNGTTGYDPTRY
jgi:hypothetical protein